MDGEPGETMVQVGQATVPLLIGGADGATPGCAGQVEVPLWADVSVLTGGPAVSAYHAAVQAADVLTQARQIAADRVGGEYTGDTMRWLLSIADQWRQLAAVIAAHPQTIAPPRPPATDERRR